MPVLVLVGSATTQIILAASFRTRFHFEGNCRRSSSVSSQDASFISNEKPVSSSS